METSIGNGIQHGLTGGTFAGHIAALMLILALASGRLRTIRLGAAGAGILWFLQSVLLQHDWTSAALAAAITFMACYQLIGAWTANKRAKLSAEDQALAAAMFPTLSKSQLRHLLDQGFWLTAKTGDVLTREGEAVPHLYYIASGSVTVYGGKQPVGRCEPGSLVGEVTVLSGDPATGTAEVDEPSRLWCVPAAKLRLYTDEHDEIRRAMETAFRRALSAKLVAANRRVTGAG